ncbi:anthranilate synthase component I [Clostridium aestuarii]|uniref:Anthranilate synthase component 1 n=1 Tax=Clostridium aestuarii TaxID=338193 RepID=A0ABT4CW69_9CLOT|nr:anthranilate synthase component I [Clostridium aestuarii]MCY6483211.1 anthranilate synthase component I [Clostridium aestuarii]
MKLGKKILVPYIKKLSGDTETPITLYKKYVGDQKGILLETTDLENGRYSFIGKNPYAILKANNNEVIIDNNYKQEIKKGKILDVVREYMKQFEVCNNTSLPFIGGAIGTIAYDIIRQYENIPNETEDTMYLPDVELMIITEFIAYDHLHNQIILCVLEEDTNEGIKKAENKIKNIQKILEEGNAELENIKLDNCNLNNIAISNTTKEQFMQMVEKAQKYIYEGDIFQVVLSQRWEIGIKEDPFTIYRKLRSINPSPYLFYLNFGDYQVVGSSPEMLVEMKVDKVYTCPIAGTRKRGQNEKEDEMLANDLLNDEKERAEHVMLVDLARNDMGRVSKIGSVNVSNFMKVKNYSHVMHLVSLVEGKTREDKDPFDVLASFLPAGTLSGAPKIRAMEIIEELEKEKRSIYGGAVGYFGFDGNMDMCIAIRTMIIKDKMAYMQAGAGIVADSIPESEYEETKNKVKALVKVVGRLEE